MLIRASIEHKSDAIDKDKVFDELFRSRISIENFTYASTQMRNQWLTLLEEIHFLGVSVCQYPTAAVIVFFPFCNFSLL